MDEESIIAMREQLKSESDRSVIILYGARLHDAVTGLVKKNLKNLNSNTKDALFGAGRPLSSFSAISDIAYAQDLVRKEDHDALSIIREMRNACAHSIKPLTFETPEIIELARIFGATDPHISISTSANADREHTRVAFELRVSCLLLTIIGGSERAEEVIGTLISKLRAEKRELPAQE